MPIKLQFLLQKNAQTDVVKMSQAVIPPVLFFLAVKCVFLQLMIYCRKLSIKKTVNTIKKTLGCWIFLSLAS